MSYNRKISLYKMSDKLKSIIEEIPVWPEEVKLCKLAHKHGYKKACVMLPTECPIAEDDGYACFTDTKSKEEYLKIIRSV